MSIRIASRWLAKGAWGLLLLVTAAAGLATLSAFFGHAWWIFDLFSNLHPQYCVVLAGAGLIFILRRRWWLSLPAWLFAAINLALLLPYYVGAPAAQASGPTMRLLLSNVYSFRPDLDEVMVLVETADPDVVVLLEMIPAHWRQVQALATEYPYLFNEPLITGTAVFSRIPLEELQPQLFLNGGRIDVLLRLQWQERPLTVLASHARAATTLVKVNQRNAHLRDLAALVAAESGSVIVAGDLNVSPWSVYFREFLRESGLQDGRRGRGIKPTWPAPQFSPLSGLILTPYDHFLASAGVAIHDYRVGPFVGSDHYPLVIDFALTGK